MELLQVTRRVCVWAPQLSKIKDSVCCKIIRVAHASMKMSGHVFTWKQPNSECYTVMKYLEKGSNLLRRNRLTVLAAVRKNTAHSWNERVNSHAKGEEEEEQDISHEAKCERKTRCDNCFFRLFGAAVKAVRALSWGPIRWRCEKWRPAAR